MRDEIASPLKYISDYFSVPWKPVENAEFMEFWLSLSAKEKIFFTTQSNYS